jgi:hypothetical protein
VITQEYLKSILDYDPETGVFTRLRRADRSPHWNGRYAGKEAGYDWTPKGGNVTYRAINIDGYPYLAHRLAVLWMTGQWPESLVDHEDLDGTNNRWANIRHADHAQNGFNRTASKNSKTGVKGVSPHLGRFRATIQANGKWRHIGTFDTIEEAAAAHKAEAALLHADFSRTS